MGAIARARIRGNVRALLVGQAPGADGDVRPLTGTMGARLADLAGLHLPGPRGYEMTQKDELVGLWADRANVLDRYPGRKGKGHDFPRAEARRAAADMTPLVLEYDLVLFCGRAVADVFAPSMIGRARWRDREMLTWHPWDRPDSLACWAWMPHTSMILPWWNDQRNVWHASKFLTELFVGLRYANGESPCAAS